MVKVKCYSMEDALKRLYKGETLYNIKQDMEISYNGEPGSRKTCFDRDIIVSTRGEYTNGFNKDFINEYTRLGGVEGCAKHLSNTSTRGILDRYPLVDAIEFKMAFEHIHSRIEPVFRPMTQFEMLGWANSDDSKGWLVRSKLSYPEDKDNRHDNNTYSQWLLPQHFKYETKVIGERSLSYEKTKLLPDHSNIDNYTIKDFTVQDTHYEFFMETHKQKKHEQGYER